MVLESPSAGYRHSRQFSHFPVYPGVYPQRPIEAIELPAKTYLAPLFSYIAPLMSSKARRRRPVALYHSLPPLPRSSMSATLSSSLCAETIGATWEVRSENNMERVRAMIAPPSYLYEVSSARAPEGFHSVKEEPQRKDFQVDFPFENPTGS